MFRSLFYCSESKRSVLFCFSYFHAECCVTEIHSHDREAKTGPAKFAVESLDDLEKKLNAIAGDLQVMLVLFHIF